MPKVVIAADGKVGVEILKYLGEFFRQDIAMCIVVPGSEVESLAISLGFRVVPWKSEMDVAHQVSKINSDFGILAWWPHILHEPLITTPKQGWINTHPSLLPHGRGKHYNFWTIVEEAPFGVSLHWVNQGIDNGDLIAQQGIGYDWTDTGESLYFKAQSEISKLFKNNYNLIREGTATRIAQEKNSGSFHRANEIETASKLDLDKLMTVRAILNILRARNFEGFPACNFTDNGNVYEVRISINKINKQKPL